MPRTHPKEATIVVDEPQVEIREAHLDDWAVSFLHYRQDSDPSPLFRGLPDDRCQCRHLGVVLTGRLTIRYADSEETYEAGDAFLARPGHLPLLYGGSTVVEFTPAEELATTSAAVSTNLQASPAG